MPRDIELRENLQWLMSLAAERQRKKYDNVTQTEWTAGDHRFSSVETIFHGLCGEFAVNAFLGQCDFEEPVEWDPATYEEMPGDWWDLKVGHVRIESKTCVPSERGSAPRWLIRKDRKIQFEVCVFSLLLIDPYRIRLMGWLNRDEIKRAPEGIGAKKLPSYDISARMLHSMETLANEIGMRSNVATA